MWGWRRSCWAAEAEKQKSEKAENAGLTNMHLCAIINLAFAGVAHLVERDLAKVEVASSSLVARSKKKRHTKVCLFFFGNLPAGRVKLAASTCAKRVKSRGEAGFLRMASASRGMLGSEFEPRRPLQKENTIRQDGVFFLEQHFCYAKVVARSQKKHHMHCIFYERSGFVNRAPSGRAAPSVKTDKRTG